MKQAARISSWRIPLPRSRSSRSAIARGGFEYQGQKCSAASRVYVPRSLWSDVRERVVAMMREMRMGDVCDFRTFIGAVIDEKAVREDRGYLDDARRNATIIRAARANDERGYFIEPTLVETADPRYRLHARGDFWSGGDGVRVSRRKWEETLRLVDATSPYALTGAVFAVTERRSIRQRRPCAMPPATSMSTTSPPAPSSGSSRSAGRAASGTNDKAGSKINLLRWVSARTIKETFSPPTDYRYGYMVEE